MTFAVGKATFWTHDALDIVLDYSRDPDELRDFEMQSIERTQIGVVRPRKVYHPTVKAMSGPSRAAARRPGAAARTAVPLRQLPPAA